MRLLLALVVAAAGGATAAVLLSGGGDERTATTTVTRTAPATTPVIPAAVERTRAAIQRAADAHDVEALRELTPDDLRYTFGENQAGGAVDHWLEL